MSAVIEKIEPLRLNLSDASKFLDVGERKFQGLVSAGKIRFVTDHANGTRYYPVAELRRYQQSLEAEQWQ